MSKYDKALQPQRAMFQQVETGARAMVDIPAISPERLAELDAATSENPVDITLDESRALHLANKSHFQMETGAGKFRHPVQPGSAVDLVTKARDKGMNNAAIAAELGLAESTVRRIVERASA